MGKLPANKRRNAQTICEKRSCQKSQKFVNGFLLNQPGLLERRYNLSGLLKSGFTRKTMTWVYLSAVAINTFTPATGSHFFGGTPSNQALTIGGLHADGSDATNELTLLMLEASALVKLREPNLSARFHSESPTESWKKAVECVKTHRSTPPQIFCQYMEIK